MSEVGCSARFISRVTLVDKSWKERRNYADGKWENIRGRLWHWYSVTVYQVMMVIVSDRRMDDFNWPILFSSFLVSKNYATSSGISCKLRDIYFVHICRYCRNSCWSRYETDLSVSMVSSVYSICNRIESINIITNWERRIDNF